MSFEKEIKETPDALDRLFGYWQIEGKAMARRRVSAITPVRQVVFTGIGSSLNAAYPAKYLLARHGISARIEPASELFYSLLNTISDDTLVIATSQSGETIETNKVVKALEGHPHLWIIANDEGSSMATSGRPTFLVKAGPENRATSKSYTNTLAMLYLLSEQIAGADGTISDEQWNGLIDTARLTLVECEEFVVRMLNHWANVDKLHVIARGPSLATANQFSLILTETTSKFAQPVDGGTFRHGYNQFVADGIGTLVLRPESPTIKLTERIAVQAAGRGSRVVVLSSCADKFALQTPADDHLLTLSLQPVAPDLAPLLEILTLEVFALRQAVQEDRDPGNLDSKVALEE